MVGWIGNLDIMELAEIPRKVESPHHMGVTRIEIHPSLFPDGIPGQPPSELRVEIAVPVVVDVNFHPLVEGSG